MLSYDFLQDMPIPVIAQVKGNLLYWNKVTNSHHIAYKCNCIHAFKNLKGICISGVLEKCTFVHVNAIFSQKFYSEAGPVNHMAEVGMLRAPRR